jgi:hypothetical protein
VNQARSNYFAAYSTQTVSVFSPVFSVQDALSFPAAAL